MQKKRGRDWEMYRALKMKWKLYEQIFKKRNRFRLGYEKTEYEMNI